MIFLHIKKELQMQQVLIGRAVACVTSRNPGSDQADSHDCNRLTPKTGRIRLYNPLFGVEIAYPPSVRRGGLRAGADGWNSLPVPISLYHIMEKIAAGKANAFALAKGICGNIRPSCPNPGGFPSTTFPNAFALDMRCIAIASSYDSFYLSEITSCKILLSSYVV